MEIIIASTASTSCIAVRNNRAAQLRLRSGRAPVTRCRNKGACQGRRPKGAAESAESGRRARVRWGNKHAQIRGNRVARAGKNVLRAA
eukprot:2059716-Prymnesium_polylepis.1